MLASFIRLSYLWVFHELLLPLLHSRGRYILLISGDRSVLWSFREIRSFDLAADFTKPTSFTTNDYKTILLAGASLLVLHVESLQPLDQLLVDGSI
jgi:hypothetical protein